MRRPFKLLFTLILAGLVAFASWRLLEGLLTGSIPVYGRGAHGHALRDAEPLLYWSCVLGWLSAVIVQALVLFTVHTRPADDEIRR